MLGEWFRCRCSQCPEPLMILGFERSRSKVWNQETVSFFAAMADMVMLIGSRLRFCIRNEPPGIDLVAAWHRFNGIVRQRMAIFPTTAGDL